MKKKKKTIVASRRDESNVHSDSSFAIGRFKGKTFPHMSAKLNAILQRDPLVETRKCSEWSLDEL